MGFFADFSKNQRGGELFVIPRAAVQPSFSFQHVHRPCSAEHLIGFADHLAEFCSCFHFFHRNELRVCKFDRTLWWRFPITSLPWNSINLYLQVKIQQIKMLLFCSRTLEFHGKANQLVSSSKNMTREREGEGERVWVCVCKHKHVCKRERECVCMCRRERVGLTFFRPLFYSKTGFSQMHFQMQKNVNGKMQLSKNSNTNFQHTQHSLETFLLNL